MVELLPQRIEVQDSGDHPDDANYQSDPGSGQGSQNLIPIVNLDHVEVPHVAVAFERRRQRYTSDIAEQLGVPVGGSSTQVIPLAESPQLGP